MADGLRCKEATKSVPWHNVTRQVSRIFTYEDVIIMPTFPLLYVQFLTHATL